MVISARQISRQFLRKRMDSNVFFAVKETDFDLNEKELAVIAGHSGSGKSTFLNMLGGILEPTSGEIGFMGKNLYSMVDDELSSFRNHHIGVMPQGQTAIQTLTVLENVLLPYTLLKGNRKYKDFDEISKEALTLLDRMGIAELKDIMPSELSGGELRRMAMARSLVMEPDVILADEPTSDLDCENTSIVMKLLRDVANEGKAVLVVTHDRDVADYADRIYRMNSGILEEA